MSSNDKYSQGTNGENLFSTKRDRGMLKCKEIGIVEVQAEWEIEQRVEIFIIFFQISGINCPRLYFNRL